MHGLNKASNIGVSTNSQKTVPTHAISFLIMTCLVLLDRCGKRDLFGHWSFDPHCSAHSLWGKSEEEYYDHFTFSSPFDSDSE